MRANTGALRKLDWLELDAADLDGGIVLPVTVADLVLVRRLEFENHDFRVPPLLDDFSHDFRFRGVRSGQKLLFVGAHGQHFAKGDFPAYFAGKSFHLHGVTWRHTVLFASTSNDGVHRPSRCKSETTIIGGIPGVRQSKVEGVLAEISTTVSRLVGEGVVAVLGDFVADIAKWRDLCQHAIAVIDAWHRTHPEHNGVFLTDLRSNLEADLPFDDLFHMLIKDLCKSEFVQVGAMIRRATHRPALLALLEAPASKLRADDLHCTMRGRSLTKESFFSELILAETAQSTVNISSFLVIANQSRIA